jgi:hypothetical protein
MSTFVRSTFTKYEFTQQEFTSASLLHEEQKRWYQSQLATLAESRIALVPDPNNYPAFIQQEAELKGQMNALQYLLDCSDAAEQEILNLAQQQNPSNTK